MEFPLIQDFCFPSGVEITRTYKEPISFNHLITNNYGSRIYCVVLQFSEELDTIHLKKLDDVLIKLDEKIYVRKCMCILSHYAFLDQSKEVLKCFYRIHLSKSVLPIERYICNFIDEMELPQKVTQATQLIIGDKTI